MNKPVNKTFTVRDQLARLVSHMESERDNRTKSNQQVEEIHGYLFGNTKQPLGMNVRLDRLEQVQENRKWTMRAMGTAVIGLIINWAFEVFKKKI